MGRVAAIGESVRVDGLTLAGVLVLPAEDAIAVRARWAELPDDVVVVILTAQAAAALPEHGDPPPLNVVMPP